MKYHVKPVYHGEQLIAYAVFDDNEFEIEGSRYPTRDEDGRIAKWLADEHCKDLQENIQ